MRSTNIIRKTNETNIQLFIDIDGKGDSVIATGIGFFNHMLTLFARHGRFDLKINCEGDTDVDYHHSVEDIGIVLGQAFAKCLDDCKGIIRYGSFTLPMDEALIMTNIDISGRPHLSFNIDYKYDIVGDFDCELIKEFFLAFVRNAGMTIHINKISGENTHHIIEGIFKSFARALAQAIKIDSDFPDEIPSTKGVL
ncbi:imidazoleglycerol-phosphate dehydratase HisB [Eubacteriales bacterium OttesenSCG-928-G02]|nr:imidazoleglycerol-phosphate dehydratase HisB [Eubacteriales bacterium OttesenSCG-928-G02]